MSADPVGNAAANLSLLRYLTTPPTPTLCPDCAGDEPEDMCADHRDEYWCDVLADRAEDEREMRR